MAGPHQLLKEPFRRGNITLGTEHEFDSVSRRVEEGIESMHMMSKGQVKRLDGRDSVGQAKFIESLFGVAA
jgi:hypothetical protein